MSALPPGIAAWLQAGGWGAITALRPVGGGCINNGARLLTDSGRSFFLKTNSAAPAEMFAREAEGLLALGAADCIHVPQPLVWGADFLLMEDLQPSGPPSRPGPGYWADFGARLAALHNHTSPRFGFEHDNFIGSTPQPNPWTDDGWTFFGSQRLLFQARLALRRGLLHPGDLRRVERIAARLGELLPAQPASLLHGDLWSGNALSDASGAAALIDPAAHYGWAEAELGMTALFGGFPGEFYRAYEQVRPLEAGWRERLPLYNLYHLLNHLNLFGGGYYDEAAAIIRRFGG